VPDEKPPAQTPDDAAEERVLISGRVQASVRRRMRRYVAEKDVNLQDLLNDALDEYLRKQGF
jgi:hypothetical protein